MATIDEWVLTQSSTTLSPRPWKNAHGMHFASFDGDVQDDDEILDFAGAPSCVTEITILRDVLSELVPTSGGALVRRFVVFR
jgi:hypothetical protein